MHKSVIEMVDRMNKSRELSPAVPTRAAQRAPSRKLSCSSVQSQDLSDAGGRCMASQRSRSTVNVCVL